MTFFDFCKKAFPEISDQAISRMVAGMEAEIFRPDEEVKRLARRAVELGVDHHFTDDIDIEQVLADLVVRASHEGMIDAAHDLSDGGLAQALVESCLRYGAGARIRIPDGIDPFVFLFSESQARAIVSVRESEEKRFADICAARGFAHQRIGVVDAGGADGPELAVEGLFSVPLEELRTAHEATFPARFEN